MPEDDSIIEFDENLPVINGAHAVTPQILPDQGSMGALFASSFSGPLPPPEMLAEYEEILPGAAERIMKSFENQTTHRHKLESSVVKSDILRSQLGQGAAVIIVLLGMWFGYELISSGKSAAGLTAMLVPLAGVAASFIASQNRKSNQVESSTDPK